MSGARLKALRLVGFKSFAERTTVEFGPGISAIVGPNGSGKSNLADALRWALGEQGRSLRTRRAEDLIFAGSSTRRAIGMADVTLVLDNEDRLLPLDFGEVELGRRLYRNGENEFLVNRERVRLRDLVELLDEANLADNAFLFIGQGMVDQALALRPEERRPLFEEAAGIRRHERRRRAAESELVEAEGNLERVRDLLAELRPQARRLAAQAEQQQARRSAGTELAMGLVAVARQRLGGAEREATAQAALLATARREADTALRALREAEEAVRGLSATLADRAEIERVARDELDGARVQLMELRLAEARSLSEVEALTHDLQRVREELAAVAARMEGARREAALPVPEPDPSAEEQLRDVERRVGEASRELAAAREMGRADEQRTRRVREAREAHDAELERARSRVRESERRREGLEAQLGTALGRADAAELTAAARLEDARTAAAAEVDLEAALEVARGALVEAEREASDAATRLGGLRAVIAGVSGRAEALDRQLGAGTAAAPRARGIGRRLDRDLDVEPALRRAVESALADVLAALVVSETALAAIGDTAGSYLVEGAASRPTRDRELAAVMERAANLGGGPLGTAVRRDPGGHAARLLGRWLWVPDRAAALAMRDALPAGWRVATLGGDVVTDEGLVRVGAAPSLLELRAERADVAQQLSAARSDLVAAEALVSATTAAVTQQRARVAAARERTEAARRARKVADEAERAAGRQHESTARELAWVRSQLERSVADAEAAATGCASLDAETGVWEDAQNAGTAPDGSSAQRAEVAALEARLSSLRRERDERAAAVDVARRAHAAAEDRRRRAEVRVTLDARRGEELQRELERLVGHFSDATARREHVSGELATAGAREAQLAATLAAAGASALDERARLRATESTAAGARERLRVAEGRARAAEVREMEVRLQLESGREGLLVELAGIGEDGLEALLAETEGSVRPATLTSEDLAPAIEAAMDAAMASWQAAVIPAGEVPLPGSGRLAALRRRYHDLGAGNPFAAQELAEVSERLGTLEAQRTDLEAAIRSTRELISRLESLISEQFRSTFAALETAFARRFEQLFGGGEAQLSLTQPEDLSATGVEITARPPGKKRQPLAMLSGGERALTAVALLLAMLEVRPVPFCVLDEVDAALDEANVGRFSSALRGLAETIQFVVITHNRGTIEAADALYGVTVGDDAVSRVISLRLGEPGDPRDPVAVPVRAPPPQASRIDTIETIGAPA